MNSIFFPAIRGTFGDWVYYSSVMPIEQIAKRVSYVKDVHKSESLSQMLQRSITKKRQDEICDYLSNTDQRFFNSLVLAVYDNHPKWYLATVASKEINSENNIKGEVGLLQFNGDEKIIPIDGQHRLAGIKLLISRYQKNPIINNNDFPFIEDMVPVIFIAHKKETEDQRLRTRRLFTTLNKYAVKVNRYEIISLDEDDPMAIVTRWLVENDSRFIDGRIKIKGGSNISIDDNCWTSIENVYDVLTILFTRVKQKVRKTSLTSAKRPSADDIEKYKKFALSFFNNLAKNHDEITEYFNLENYDGFASKKRKEARVLFRPVGLKLIANLIAKFENLSMEERFSKIRELPYNLNKLPYYRLLVNDFGKIQDGNEVKVRNLLLSSIGVKLNAVEKKSAKAGISILTGEPQSKITEDYLPKSIQELDEIANSVGSISHHRLS